MPKIKTNAQEIFEKQLDSGDIGNEKIDQFKNPDLQKLSLNPEKLNYANLGKAVAEIQ